MVDAILSTILEQLTSMAVDEAKEQVRLVTGVAKEVEKLTSNLGAIQAVLRDAEKKQIKKERVRLWLDGLRCACYDMEDVLGEWNTARLKLQIDGVDDDPENDTLVWLEKVCSFFPPASCFGCKQLVLRRRIALKIKEINETLDEIAKQKNVFGFAVNVINSYERADQPLPAISSIDESEIFGRQKEKNELVNRLLCESSEEQRSPCVISLVGMGGIGKTTLAQLAYNNGDVKKHFDKRIWVSVSDPFDVFRIARAIIEALTGSASNFGEFESLMQHVQRCVKDKKFLLVLDDVWNEDYYKWEPFYNCLKNDLHGSKILITTRKDKVAHCMKSTNVIFVNLLSEIECWYAFERLAFFNKSKEKCEKLETIGRQIVRKCKGLPLAAKTIASLLQSRNTENEWQNILESEIWELEEVERGLLAPLLLSYNELPSKVKQCFTYCAVFPKDYSIRKKELINLWMAQGYLSEKRAKEMEDIGEEYFKILASRSFFQDFEKDDDGEIYKCKMHDIVHDFAQYLCSNECLTIEIHGGEESAVSSFEEEKVLHLRLSKEDSSIEKKVLSSTSVPIAIWNNVKRMRRLRSLLVKGDEYSWSSKVLPQLFDKLTCLRALELESVDWGWDFIKEIPTNIEKLIHLKYLSLANQREIETLPETLCELYNLERLDVSWCLKLGELPQGIGKLRKLMYLHNEMTVFLRYLPAGIGELISLRRVTEFDVGGGYDRACSLGSLKKLNLLRECSIHGLGGMSDAAEARRAELEKKKNLVELELHFGHSRAWIREDEEDEDERLLEALGPPPNLKKLRIYEYRGRRNVVPINWFMSLTNLTVLFLFRWSNCEHLPPLGKLPSLESLEIAGMKSVKRVGNEFLGVESDTDGSSVTAFPKLKELIFADMEELEEWDLGTAIKGGIIIMPCLSSLSIEFCPKLKALPDHLLQKTTLQKLYIRVSPILEERCREETGEDWPEIRHITNIEIE